MVSKKLGFQTLRDLLNSGMQKKVFGTFYRTTIRPGKKTKKSDGRMWEKLEMTSNDSFLKNVSLNPRSVNDSHRRCSVKKVFCLSPATLSKKSLWHWCFPVNFAKFLRKLIL